MTALGVILAINLIWFLIFPKSFGAMARGTWDAFMEGWKDDV